MRAELSAEVVVSRNEWSRHLGLFDDASIYQTWDYAQSMFPGQKAVRLTVRSGDTVAGVAQARVVALPRVSRGIAYVAWGPLWQKRGASPNWAAFQTVLQVLKEELVVKRKLLLRVAPNLMANESGSAVQALEEAGFRTVESRKPYHTIVLDLVRSLEEIRGELRPNWRNHLKGSVRAGVELREGTSDEDYATFLAFYGEMKRRKTFESGVDVGRMAEMQSALPESEKLRIFTAWKDGRPGAAVVVSFLGDTGRCLLRATGEEGRKTKGSYALQWRVIERLKGSGFRYYDLGGIDAAANPGVYHFKAGMGGQETRFVGTFECCVSPASRIIVSVGEGLRTLARCWR